MDWYLLFLLFYLTWVKSEHVRTVIEYLHLEFLICDIDMIIGHISSSQPPFLITVMQNMSFPHVWSDI